MVVHSKFSDVSSSNGYYEDVEVQEQFYDAIAADSSSSEDEDSDDSNDPDKKVFYFSPLLLIRDKVQSERFREGQKCDLWSNLNHFHESILLKRSRIDTYVSSTSGQESEAEECLMGNRKLSFEANFRSSVYKILFENMQWSICYHQNPEVF